MATYYNCTSVTSSTRHAEKEELQRLNDRLAQYIQQMRSASSGESKAFILSVKHLEDDVANLKSIYEKELESLRIQLESANKDKNGFHSQAERNRLAIVEYEDRLKTEVGKNQQLVSEISRLRDTIATLESRLAEAQAAVRHPEAEVERLQREVNSTAQMNQELARRLEVETAAKNQLTDKYNDLLKKLEFDAKVHAEQLKEMQGRLDQATILVGTLESRTQELDKMGGSVPEIVRRIRATTETELKKYQKDSEDTYSKNLAALKARIDEQAAVIEQLRGDNKKLWDTNNDLMPKLRALEAQIRDLQKQNEVLEGMLKQERAHGAEQVLVMENKLKELQNHLVALMKECNIDKDINVSLRTEIETMKTLLSEEEQRLHAVSSSSSAAHQGTQLLSTSRVVTSGVRRSTPQYTEGGLKMTSVNVNDPKSKTLLYRQYTPLTTYRAGYCQPSSYTFNRSRTLYPNCTTDKSWQGGWTTGTTKMRYSTTDIRGDGRLANSPSGKISCSFPKVHQ